MSRSSAQRTNFLPDDYVRDKGDEGEGRQDYFVEEVLPDQLRLVIPFTLRRVYRGHQEVELVPDNEIGVS